MMIETSDAVVTVSVADPLTAPYEAVIVVTPSLTPVATPVSLMKAKLATEEFQDTCNVRSWVVLSVKTPVAVNCTFPLIPTTVVAGVTTIAVRAAGVTVRVAESVREPYATVIVDCPGAIPVACPFASIEAVAAEDEVQVSPADRG